MLKRPIIIFGGSLYNKNLQIQLIENISGLYLPLLVNSKECERMPICISFAQNHFAALVSTNYGAENYRIPIFDHGRTPFEVHFTHEENINSLMEEYLNLSSISVNNIPLLCVKMDDKNFLLENNLSVKTKPSYNSRLLIRKSSRQKGSGPTIFESKQNTRHRTPAERKIYA